MTKGKKAHVSLELESNLELSEKTSTSRGNRRPWQSAWGLHEGSSTYTVYMCLFAIMVGGLAAAAS